MTERFSVSLDRSLVEAFDNYLRRYGYASRSEAVRDLLREFLARGHSEHDPKSQGVGVLSYVYAHQEYALSQQLVSEYHGHHNMVIATLHVHLDHEHCLECTVLRGPIGQMRAFAGQVVAQRGVRHGDFHLIPTRVDTNHHSHGVGDHAYETAHDHITPYE